MIPFLIYCEFQYFNEILIVIIIRKLVVSIQEIFDSVTVG